MNKVSVSYFLGTISWPIFFRIRFVVVLDNKLETMFSPKSSRSRCQPSMLSSQRVSNIAGSTPITISIRTGALNRKHVRTQLCLIFLSSWLNICVPLLTSNELKTIAKHNLTTVCQTTEAALASLALTSLAEPHPVLRALRASTWQGR